MVRTGTLLLILFSLTACSAESDANGLFGERYGTHDPDPVPPLAGTGGQAGDAGASTGGTLATGGAAGQPATGGLGGIAAGGATGGSAGMPATGGAPSITGQCGGVCGAGSSDGTCWCDDVCKLYGDCCADFVATCPVQANANPGNGCTVNHCNTDTPTADGSQVCYCDSACAQYGDCCANKLQICG